MNLDISYYVSVFLRRIYVMIIVAFGMTAAAVYIAMQLPPTYRADAQLLVESPQIPTNLASSTVQVDSGETLQIIQQRLMTRDNLLQIARRHEVAPNLDRLSSDEIVQLMRQNTRINRSSGRSQATVMAISFTSDDAQTAAAVVNEYVTRVLEENRAMRTALAEETMDFFQQEVDRLTQVLSEKSADIVEFKRQNAQALPTSLTYRQDRLSTLEERLSQVERELATLEEQELRLRELFESGEPLAEEDAATPDARRLARLREDLDSALALYSSTNPRVRILQAQVQQAEQKLLAAADGEIAAGETTRETLMNAQLEEIDDQRQQLLDQKAYIDQEIETLSASIAETPEISIAIDSLEREYANVRSQYDQATARLATAATGERIELLSKGERISVIESATAPSRPTSPNRPLIAGAGAVAGIGLGTALIFLLELLNQSIRRPVDLERQLGVTPIATLPYIRTRREVLWKRAALIALIVLVVVGAPALIYVIHTYVMPLDMIIETIVSQAFG